MSNTKTVMTAIATKAFNKIRFLANRIKVALQQKLCPEHVTTWHRNTVWGWEIYRIWLHNEWSNISEGMSLFQNI